MNARKSRWFAQVEGAFNRTLDALRGAGVVLVPFDAQAMVEYQDKNIGDSTFYTYEMGREVSRCARMPPRLGCPGLMG
jgi:hypothetical protein